MFEVIVNRWTNYDGMHLSNDLRKLWEQHVFWTRLFIVSTLAELSDLDVTTDRLLRNPTDFANILEKFYGRQNADIFRNLLEEHLTTAASVVNSAKQQNTEAVEHYSRLWYHNADQIAAFLAGINPLWSEAEWRNLLYDHLRMTTDEVLARLAGDHAREVAIFDMIEEQALDMADVMTAGIVKQFEL
ncbi:MAG TPA: hypothetical protein VN381_09455 [Anaerovoracaceae bacterium]|nr:hypothetical protein [Anaerovoracaceae bacterium]